ncbi:hypothetical protein Taro_054011 [Colocasia esculenta]|uniref:Retrotransposon gag domain-containing protein n=1 Tax=Colocasia esculenta TaxID=4460 RepID=A0A843XPB2_COLES|nr:hypothetical protein [Colocasia esculenta]
MRFEGSLTKVDHSSMRSEASPSGGTALEADLEREEDYLTAKYCYNVNRQWRLVDVEELVRPGVMSQQEVLKLQLSRHSTRLAQAPAPEAGFGGVSMMERFGRMTPPFFKGESDPILAESWLWETEMIFRAIRCAEEERVTLATYMLQVSWAEFVRLFRAKYIPKHVQDRMEKEFLTLT